MPVFIKTRWPLFLVLLVFTIVKIPALHYPFFWDESWSYAPAVRLMYQHGPSLMPDAIDSLYSRGHPLLFYASAAAWMKLFGDSYVAQHTFCLLVSVLLLITIYEVCLRLFSKRMAVIGLLAMATQVMFFVQSTLLLPEVMVALLALSTLFFYTLSRHLLTFTSCTALVLTKESGATLGLLLGIHALYNLVNKETSLKERLYQLASVAGAGMVLAIFFAIQYRQNHWVLYPEHTGYINTHWPVIMGKYRFILEILFTHQARLYMLALTCIMAIIMAVKNKDIRHLAILAAAVVFTILTTNTMGYLSRKALIPVSFGLFFYTFITLVPTNRQQGQQRLFIRLSAMFFIVYVAFCCINFFTDRYLLTALVFLLLLISYAIDSYLEQLPKGVFYGSVAAVLAIGSVAFTTGTRAGDVNLGIYDAMTVQQDVVVFMTQHQLQNEHVASTSSLQRAHLAQPNTGFLPEGSAFKKVTYEINDSTRYLIVDNIEVSDTMHPQPIPSTFKQVYRTQHREWWAEVYERR